MANYYYATKKTVSGPSYLETTTTYNFTADAQGLTASNRETASGGAATADFPTSFSAITTGATNSKVNRRDTATPSGNSVLGPQDVGNFYIYTEASGIASGGAVTGQRYCILLPGDYDRDNGLSLTAKVSLTRYTANVPAVALYHRPVGGTNTDWLLAGTGPSSLGGATFVWQDWIATDVITAGDPVELMVVFYTDGATGAEPDKALFDNGIDDIVITETTLV